MTPKVPNKLSDQDRAYRDAWDAEYQEQRINDGNAMRGLIVAIILTLLMAGGAYQILHWYVGTIPARIFTGFAKPR